MRRWQPAARLLALGLLLGLQLTFLAMVLGNFPFIATAAVVPFLPARAWDALGRVPACMPRRAAANRMLGAAPDGASRRALRLARRAASRMLTARRRDSKAAAAGVAVAVAAAVAAVAAVAVMTRAGRRGR